MMPIFSPPPLMVNHTVMNTTTPNTDNKKLRLKRLKQGPRVAIRRFLRSFEPLEKPPKTSNRSGPN